MPTQPLNGLVQHLRKVAAVQTLRDLPDAELLDRFVTVRDDAAFTVLIERHGSMVFGVCRRTLPSIHDAEDACQVAFLVLARKAASVRRKSSLASWLHGVARRAAVRLKRDHARRVSRERRQVPQSETDPAAEMSWREAQSILDEELEQLPERYRAPLILCYLECQTRDEAAMHLGVSPGALHGRLERARERLRRQLIKRGVTLAAAISAAAFGQSAQGMLSPELVLASANAALEFAAGRTVAETMIAPHVLVLTKEVLKTMFLTKLKLGTAAILCASVLMLLVGGSFDSLTSAQETPEKASAKPPQKAVAKPETDADFIRRISKDLRGSDPSPAEVHFFVTSKDPGRREKLIDLFIQERQAKQHARAAKDANDIAASIDDLIQKHARDLGAPNPRDDKYGKVVQDYYNALQPMLPADLHGVVKKINANDPALVSISIGSDAGLAINHVLDAYRLAPRPMYLGKVRIVEVQPDQAVARRVGNLPGNTSLMVGDQVTSSLAAPPEKK